MFFVEQYIPEAANLWTRKKESAPEVAHDDAFWLFYDQAKPFSLLHVAGFYNLYQSIKYLKQNDIRGAFVECGCFLGGAAIFMGLMRIYLNWPAEIYLFDTFEGAPVGSSDMLFGVTPIDTPNKQFGCREHIKENILSVLKTVDGYTFIEGPVEETLPKFKVPKLALARLDTDFYSSTKIEHEILYPRLQPGGVWIVDDYGIFTGSRKATDEYFATCPTPPLLNRVDGGIWAGVKPSEPRRRQIRRALKITGSSTGQKTSSG